MVTVAPGTDAPDASLTVPKMVPVGNWAKTGSATSDKISATTQLVLKHTTLCLAMLAPSGWRKRRTPAQRDDFFTTFAPLGDHPLEMLCPEMEKCLLIVFVF
jgi:hypothetical protein